ncbi:MAG: regulator [Microbacteriaceae bacterium]|nr:regulator [Microbacteriaceae bacterium]
MTMRSRSFLRALRRRADVAQIALALPPGSEEQLVQQLQHHGHEVSVLCSSADELIAAFEGGHVGPALVAASPLFLDSRVLAQADSCGVRMLALTRRDADRHYAEALGLLETAPMDAPWAHLEAVLLGRAEAPAQSEAPEAALGEVIAVWGPAGSPGRTTLAIAIASELAALGHSVALCDVDTYSGSVAPALGLLDEAPGFAAACRLAGAGGLTRAELERIAERYTSRHGSFRVLTGIGRPDRWPELSADRVSTTIRECRSWVDYTVIDTGASLESDEEISSDLFAPRRNAATRAALADADLVIAVGSADPVGLSRFLRAYVDLVELLGSRQPTVVMNRIRAGSIGLNPTAQVRQSLWRFAGIDDPVLVPHDLAALDAAVLGGTTLLDVAAKSAARVAIRALVTERIVRQPVASAGATSARTG